MRSVFAALVALQAIGASAMPGLFERQTTNGRCNADNCLRVLRDPRSSAARSADCSAFLAKTVVLCESTRTVSTTVTSTSVADGPTSTVVVAQGTATNTVSSTSVVTVLTTSTVTLARRDLQERACVTTTSSSTAVPAYATNSCQNNVSRFSSACSCFGVTSASATTVASATVTVPGVTTTTTSTRTTFVGVTSAATTTTTTVTVLSTTTSTVTSTTTTGGAPACATFAIFNVASNPGTSQVNFNRDFTTGTVTLGDADNRWVLQSNSKLTPLANQGQGIVLSQFESSGQPFDRMNVDSDPQPKNLICSVSGGFLTCSGSNGNGGVSNKFYVCPQYSLDQSYASGRNTLYISDGTNLPSSCRTVTLRAEPRC